MASARDVRPDMERSRREVEDERRSVTRPQVAKQTPDVCTFHTDAQHRLMTPNPCTTVDLRRNSSVCKYSHDENAPLRRGTLRPRKVGSPKLGQQEDHRGLVQHPSPAVRRVLLVRVCSRTALSTDRHRQRHRHGQHTYPPKMPVLPPLLSPDPRKGKGPISPFKQTKTGSGAHFVESRCRNRLKTQRINERRRCEHFHVFGRYALFFR